MPSPPETNSPTTDDLRIEAANWLRLQELYHLLDTTPVEQQTEVLDRATADPVLRTRVLSLLATAAEPDVSAPAMDAAVAPGARVGPYAILRHLGSGGLGTVYLVERMIGGAVQQCALKLLTMRSTGPSFHSRFQREQQILATLQHPNITHLLDAGINELGQPYLVMEFVDGLDLTRYCDEHDLPLQQRLEIFLAICDAVAYAHSKLVVHLDLKPSNVLVTEAGKVKLLDFGTSKLIESESTMTTTVMATPAYASPEQLRGEPVTTGCDLYSLGAMLYELLAGQRPFETGSAAMAINRAVAEQEPPRLTASVTNEAAQRRGVPVERLRRMLRGDLASIVARCLRSRPRDRYSSVEALAEDLRRYLAGRPVLARRQTATYRLTKFVRRNRIALSAGMVVLLLLLGTGAFAYRRQQQALEQGRRAEQMQIFMTRLFRLSHSAALGKPAATVAEMLQIGNRILPSLVTDHADLRAARLSLAESMYDDDDTKDALPILLNAAADAERSGDIAVEAKADALAGDIQYLLGNSAQGDALTTRALALSRNRSVTVRDRTQITALYVSNHDDAGDRTESSMNLLRSAIAESEKNSVPEEETASAMNILGLGLQARNHLSEAQSYFERSLAIYRRTPYATCDAAYTERYLAYLRYKAGDDAAALAGFQQSYDQQRRCAGDEDLATLSVQAWLAGELDLTGHPQQAIDMLEPALERWRKVVGPESQHMQTPLEFLSRAYLDVGRYHDAELASREELKVLQGKLMKKSARTAGAEERLGEALARQDRFQEALPLLESAVEDHPLPPDPTPRDRSSFLRTQQWLANVRAQLGKTDAPTETR